MSRRLGKASQSISPKLAGKTTPRTHFKRHVHLTNNIHVKNLIHMQKNRVRMLDSQRATQLPLRRELTAVKKVKSLRDPSTSSSYSPASVGSSVTKASTFGAYLDELQSQENLRRPARRSKAREGADDGKNQGHRECNGKHVDTLKSHRWDGELDIDSGAQMGELKGRGRRRNTDEYAALAQRGDRNQDRNRPDISSQQHREGLPWSRGYRVDERWQGDAEEIARRLIAEQNGHIASPAHSYMSNLARAHGLALLGFRDDITTSEAEGSFVESEDGETGLMAPEQVGISSPHMSNLGSTLVRGQRKPRSNGRRCKDGQVSLRVGLHSRGRPPPRRSVHGYKEAPVVPTMTDELDVSDIPQNGCGMPWYWTSGSQKYKGKGLLDYAGIGLTCAFPEAIKKKTVDPKQVSRNTSRHGSQRDLQVPLSLDPDNHAVPLLMGAKESHDEIEVPELLTHEQRELPARETPASIPQMQEEKRSQETEGSSSKTTPHRSMSQKYRPKAFKDLVGQTLVVKALTTAVTKGKVAPVYLFSGPRGTGKTTCARIFAAALVCLNTEPHRRPCGLCRECATITLNRSRDVKEIDVASSPDFEDMRSLLSLPPSNMGQRVFIVEGCDFLSTELWTSFLKFLDDPPRNVVFILITTDLERLPISATSRCQKYHFGKLKESEIVVRLQTLAERENFEVEGTALSLIASRADGSLRDAETMLDQLSLFDQIITLSMVQEISGLIPEDKLLNLLDLALAADTVNTVKGMRELLDAGIDALSLVAQLASLITNILAGTFELRRETRKKGFFQRNMPKREEQQRLRQALKVLAECEKQLRASNDRPTWLTAALLQFAPDRSYLPSSVDTSVAPSPIAFDTLERVPTGEPFTPRLPSPQPGEAKTSLIQRKTQKSSKEVVSRLSGSVEGQKDKDKALASMSPAGRKAPLVGNQLQAKVHSSKSEFASGQAEERDLSQTSSLVLFDPSRTHGNRDFRVLSRRDLEDIWGKVLDECRSNVLRQLLSSQGTLMTLLVARDETYAVAHVEFRGLEHKARAERLRSSTCHAFQMAMGCPVELKLSLECPPSVVFEEIKASHVSEPDSSTTEVKIETSDDVARGSENTPSAESGPSGLQPQQRRKKPQSRQEMLTGLAARSRRLGDMESIRSNRYCFPSDCVLRDTAGLSRRQRSGRRPSLNRVSSGRREYLDSQVAKRVPMKWKYPKFKGVTSMERKNKRKCNMVIDLVKILHRLSQESARRKLEPRHKRSRGVLCWQSPLSEKDAKQVQPQRQPEHRGVTFFLRLVPCGRSTRLQGLPSRP